MTTLNNNASIADAVAAMQRLKQEHNPILQQLASDQGMAAETRRLLIEHLLEEEDEHLAHMATLAGGVAGSSAAPAGSSAPGGLTVGSLRPEPSPLSIGSLRDD